MCLLCPGDVAERNAAPERAKKTGEDGSTAVMYGMDGSIRFADNMHMRNKYSCAHIYGGDYSNNT